MNGTLTSTPSDLPVPKAVVLENVTLDTKRIFDFAEAVGGAKFTEEGYRPTASLIPHPVNEDQLTWYLHYAGGDYRVVFTVIIDAVTGKVTTTYEFTADETIVIVY